MTPERRQRVEAIVRQALERPSGERSAFLTRACEGDADLRRDAADLLESSGGSGRSSSTPAASRPATGSPPPQAAGRRLGIYRLDERIGAGGMGEVYRARDTRLGRDVALKMLPPAFTDDPDRVARFEREARALAALNHPNIATIHGVEDAGGVRAIVMELVEGTTLEERLARGVLPLRAALDAARQVAAALDAAHEKGIVHRDLKPANIKIAPDGRVKVLDFGLAKALGGDARQSSLDAPTMADAATREGLVMGTAAYMSPEQARGQAVDKRADIWAFGCVLYEMLTGRAAFARDSVADTLAAILEREPDWEALAGFGAPVVALVRKCLEKDPRRRLRDIGDIDLPAIEAAGPGPMPRARSILVAWSVAATASVLALAVLLSGLRADPAPAPPPARFEIAPPVRVADTGPFAVSPDGRHLVFAGTGADGVLRLWMRDLDALDVVPVSGTEGQVAYNTSPMTWSPDARFIAFYADGKLKKIERTGGETQVICDLPANMVAIGASWNLDDVIVAGSSGGGLLRCPARGGPPAEITKVNPDERGVSHLFPWFLPDGRHVLYLRVSRTDPSQSGLHIADLAAPGGGPRGDRLVATGFGGAYVPRAGRAGHVLYVREGTLWAAPFDSDRLAVTGDPIRTAGPVGSFLDGAFFSASPGALVYSGASPDVEIVWRNRRGERLGAVGAAGQLAGVSLSPDATRAMVIRGNQLNRADRDLWLVDVARNATTRFTFDPLMESAPVWSPDGKSVLYALGPGSVNVYRKAAEGTSAQELAIASADAAYTLNQLLLNMSPTPDGRFVIANVVAHGTDTGMDLWLLPLEPGGRPAPLLQLEFDQTAPQVSPDGRWLAYVSNESGVDEVFVRRLEADPALVPKPGGATLVSRGGGAAPRWRRDARELFYLSGSGSVMAAPMAGTGPGMPTELFRADGALREWGVAPDGERFLMALPVRQAPPFQFTIVLNWRSALAR